MRFAQFTLLVTVFTLHHAYVSALEESPPFDCKNVPALKSSRAKPISEITDWIVVRVTLMTNPESFDPKTNTCSVHTYVDKCGTIQQLTGFTGVDGENCQYTETYAYFSDTNNLVHYEETITKEDENYEIWSRKLDSMEYFAADGGTTGVDKIPNLVLKTYENKFATVAVDKGGKWLIQRDCGSDITWVLFPKDDLCEIDDPVAYIATFNADIDQHITDMRIDPTTVVPIATKVEIDPFLDINSKKTSFKKIGSAIKKVVAPAQDPLGTSHIFQQMPSPSS